MEVFEYANAPSESLSLGLFWWHSIANRWSVIPNLSQMVSNTWYPDYYVSYVSIGKVKPAVDSVYAFEDVQEAYARIMSSRASGKVVVKVDPTVE